MIQLNFYVGDFVFFSNSKIYYYLCGKIKNTVVINLNTILLLLKKIFYLFYFCISKIGLNTYWLISLEKMFDSSFIENLQLTNKFKFLKKYILISQIRLIGILSNFKYAKKNKKFFFYIRKKPNLLISLGNFNMRELINESITQKMSGVNICNTNLIPCGSSYLIYINCKSLSNCVYFFYFALFIIEIGFYHFFNTKLLKKKHKIYIK